MLDINIKSFEIDQKKYHPTKTNNNLYYIKFLSYKIATLNEVLCFNNNRLMTSVYNLKLDKKNIKIITDSHEKVEQELIRLKKVLSDLKKIIYFSKMPIGQLVINSLNENNLNHMIYHYLIILINFIIYSDKSINCISFMHRKYAKAVEIPNKTTLSTVHRYRYVFQDMYTGKIAIKRYLLKNIFKEMISGFIRLKNDIDANITSLCDQYMEFLILANKLLFKNEVPVLIR